MINQIILSKDFDFKEDGATITKFHFAFLTILQSFNIKIL